MSIRRLFVANWKMNFLRSEARDYAQTLGALLSPATDPADPSGPELVIAPPYPALADARDPASDGGGGGRWALAAQNVASHEKGAFTGEVSARMLRDAGCRYVLVGHSERRRLFGEEAPILAAKMARVREAGLLPIYCLGETEEERALDLTENVLAAQVETLADYPSDAPLVVAYEPVWAIGTGKAATADDAAAARRTLERLLAARGRTNVRLLYGGSVTAEIAADLIEGCGMDGFLIGGASLDPRAFAAIAGLRRGTAPA